MYGLELANFSYGIGISTGEFIGCAILGQLPYEKTIELAKIKGECNAAVPDQKNWKVLAVKADYREVEKLIKDQPDIHICAISGPDQTGVSGRKELIDSLIDQLENEKIVATLLALSSGTNNPEQVETGHKMGEFLRTLPLKPLLCPMISNYKA